jgi:hypothetical protein
MLRRILTILAALSAIGLVWITQTTAPASVHPLVVLLIFGMLYVLVLSVLTFYIFWGSRLVVRFVRIRRTAGQNGVSIYRAYIYASVLAFGPVALLAMRSVGQESLGDILLVVLFEALACFYVWRRS